MGPTRDRRDADWFWMNNAVLDHYGSKIGVHGIAVYALLARHANREGQAIPSLRYMAEKLGIGTSTVQRYLEKLITYGLIERQRRMSEHGDFTSTEYFLLTIKAPTQDANGGGVSTANTPVSPENTPVSNMDTPKKEKSKASVNNELSNGGVSTANTPVSPENTPVSPVNQRVYPQEIHGVSTVNNEQDLLNQTDLEPDLNPLSLPSQNGCVSESIAQAEAAYQDYTPGFELVCAAHPSQPIEGKKQAFGVWQAKKLEPRAPEIAEKLARLVITKWADRTYYPLLKTWLTNADYDDELVPLEAAHTKQGRKISVKGMHNAASSARILAQLRKDAHD